MSHALALVAAAVGTVAAGVGGFIAQAAPASGGEAIAPWLYGGGSVAAVACLAYIARQFANGSVVARNTAEAMTDQKAREDRLAELVETGHRREQDYLNFLREGRP